MTNYEHIIEGGIEALIEFQDAQICKTCSLSPCDYDYAKCYTGRLEWLQQEYVEPDSWEKLLADLDRAGDYLIHTVASIEYFGDRREISTGTKDSYMDIAARIRALLESDAK